MVFKKTNFKLENLCKIYFYFMLLELFIGGAGRLITIGSLTLRMYLFMGAMVISIILFLNGYKISQLSKIVILLFIFIFSLGILNGLLHYTETSRIIDDAKMASFFFILPFFDFLINDRKTINVIINLIKFSALVMAISYLLILIALFTGFTNFQELYDILAKEEYAEEFGFRGEGAIMYKGFAYMCMGFFFFLFEKNKLLKITACSIILIATILTLTRGLIVVIGIITIPYFIYQTIVKEKKVLVGAIVLLILAVGIIVSVPIYLETLGDKTDSDLVRTIQISQVIERIDWKSWLIGHGYGVGLPISAGHLEITYFELFHKLGFLGLLYWLFILLALFILYKRSSIIDKAITTPIIFSVLFLYIESATNPFLINSIGLTLIFIAMNVLYKLPNLNIQDESNNELSYLTFNNLK
jgi:hypothetical protein